MLPRISQFGAWAAFAAAATILSLSVWAYARTSLADPDRLADLPRVLLWAWERPENFSFLQPEDAGVVVLAATISLSGDAVDVHPRMQPVVIPAGVVAFPVIRIETNRVDPPTLSAEQRGDVVQVVLALLKGREIPALQIDFDAVVSEREFYRDFLRSLREALPERTALSMTALASWCLRDPWIADLPVDEAVPLLFSMGPDGGEVKQLMESGAKFSLPICRLGLGVATDEAVRRPESPRTYVFHSGPWTAGVFGSLN